MGKSLSVIKNVRQNEKRRERNLVYKLNIRKARKKIEKLITIGGSKEEIIEAYREYTKFVDKAAKKNIIHKNNAARKKSRMNKKIKNFLLSK